VRGRRGKREIFRERCGREGCLRGSISNDASARIVCARGVTSEHAACRFGDRCAREDTDARDRSPCARAIIAEVSARTPRLCRARETFNRDLVRATERAW
jgi:hypothetical protein